MSPALTRTEHRNERAQLAEHHRPWLTPAVPAEPAAPAGPAAPEAFAGMDWTAEAEACSTIPCSR